MDVWVNGNKKVEILQSPINFTPASIYFKYGIYRSFISRYKNLKGKIPTQIVFYDEISDLKVVEEGNTTTSANVLFDILRKISADSEINFDLKSENKLSLKSESADFNLLCLPTDNFPTFSDKFDEKEISFNNQNFLKLLILFLQLIRHN